MRGGFLCTEGGAESILVSRDVGTSLSGGSIVAGARAGDEDEAMADDAAAATAANANADADADAGLDTSSTWLVESAAALEFASELLLVGPGLELELLLPSACVAVLPAAAAAASSRCFCASRSIISS